MKNKTTLFLSIILCVGLLLGSLTFAACPPKSTDANWQRLHTQAAMEWGFEGSKDEFVDILLGQSGDKDDLAHIGRSAHQIFSRHNPWHKGTQSEWVQDLTNGHLLFPTLCEELLESVKTDFYYARGFNSPIDICQETGRFIYQFIGARFFFCRYYGTINGSSIFFIGDSVTYMPYPVWSMSVDEYTFTHRRNAMIVVYKDNSMYRIDYAFNNEILSRDDVRVIFNAHGRASLDQSRDNPTKMPEYNGDIAEGFRQRGIGRYHVYLGTYNQASVFAMDSSLMADRLVSTQHLFPNIEHEGHRVHSIGTWNLYFIHENGTRGGFSGTNNPIVRDYFELEEVFTMLDIFGKTFTVLYSNSDSFSRAPIFVR
ncbi:MAG: hypothetical protein FWD86_02700 [Firmicutes bacterium]|nr:hypothetical protein [Bacillota bacterium]